MELYFDQDNGILGYLTEDNNFIPVKTNAQLDPTHINLDEDGCLYLKSYVDDTIYQLKDAEGHPISLKGEKGDNGKDGMDGKDGTDGKDGQDGADGEDGKDGANGQDGKDGITPQLKIEDGYWYISYDNGATWTQLGKATGEDGKDGANGTNGTDGKDGQDGADGYNPFTEEEVAHLKTLPETIINLQSRITALEQALQQIDLSGLSIAYPILTE